MGECLQRHPHTNTRKQEIEDSKNVHYVLTCFHADTPFRNRIYEHAMAARRAVLVLHAFGMAINKGASASVFTLVVCCDRIHEIQTITPIYATVNGTGISFGIETAPKRTNAIMDICSGVATSGAQVVSKVSFIANISCVQCQPRSSY